MVSNIANGYNVHILKILIAVDPAAVIYMGKDKYESTDVIYPVQSLDNGTRLK